LDLGLEGASSAQHAWLDLGLHQVAACLAHQPPVSNHHDSITACLPSSIWLWTIRGPSSAVVHHGPQWEAPR
jgi:hypothetical protein